MRIFFFITLVGVVSSAQAQNFWHQTNGPYAGNVTALTFNSKGEVFAGTGSASSVPSMFKSSDGGSDWTLLQHWFVTFGEVSCLAVNYSDDLFAGVRNGGSPPGNPPGDGVWRSTDDGITWVQVGLSGTAVSALVISSNGDIFVGTGGYLASGSGVYRSTNNGATWGVAGLSSSTVLCLTIGRNGNLFAGTSDGKLHRSTDAGATWVDLVGGYGTTLAIDSSGDIIAGNLNYVNGGLSRSTDNGASWTSDTNGLLPYRSVQINGLLVSATGEIYAGSPSQGLSRSLDRGVTWAPLLTRPTSCYPNFTSICTDGKGDIVAGSYATGITRSTDNGSTWMQSGLPLKLIQAIAVSKSGKVYAGASLWNSCDSGISVSSDDGATWSGSGLAGFAVPSLAIHGNGDVFAGANPNGTLSGMYRSSDDGVTWRFKGIANSVVAFIAMASNGDVYGGTQATGVYRSVDTGTSWSKANTGLTPFNGALNILCLAASPHGEIFAAVGSYSDSLFRSTNNGAQWTHTGVAGIACVAVNEKGYVFASGAYNLYRSTDDGVSWTQLCAPFPQGAETYPMLAIDSSGRIYALFRDGHSISSTDDGGSWSGNYSGMDTALFQGGGGGGALACGGDGKVYAATGTGYGEGIFLGYGNYGSPQHPSFSIALSPFSGATCDSVLQMIELHNTSSSVLTIDSMLTQDPFRLVSKYYGDVNPGDSTQVGIWFRPSKAGPVAGNVTVYAHFGCATYDTTLTLSGTATTGLPVMQLSSNVLQLTNLPACQVTFDTLLVSNTGCGTLNLTATLSNTTVGFSLTQASFTVPVDSTVRVILSVQSKKGGTYTTNLVLHGQNGDKIVPVSATVSGAGSAAISLSTDTINFGSISVCQSAVYDTIRVRSIGCDTVLYSTSITDTTGGFSMASSGSSIPADSESVIILTLKPYKAGTFITQLTIHYQYGDSVIPVSVTVSGLGSAAISLSAKAVNFGSISTCHSAVFDTIHVHSTGCGSVQYSARISDTTGGFSAIISGSSIPVDSEAEVILKLLPDKSGVFSTQLIIHYQGGDSIITVSATVSGSGSPAITLSIDALNFGSISSCQGAVVDTIHMRSIGCGAVQYSARILDTTGGFSLTSSGSSIPVDSEALVILALQPNTTGTFSTELIIHYQGGDSVIPVHATVIAGSGGAALSLSGPGDIARPGVPRVVTLNANPIAQVAGAGAFRVIIQHDSSTLELSSVSSPSAITSRVEDKASGLVTLTFAGCPAGTTNPIAALTYQTLVGPTLSPQVSLLSASSSSTCMTVQGLTPVTLMLSPLGCEIGTLDVTRFTSGIISITPNPTSDNIQIDYGLVETVPVRIELENMLGQTVDVIENDAAKPGNFTASFSLHGLTSGSYFVIYRAGATREVRNIALQH